VFAYLWWFLKLPVGWETSVKEGGLQCNGIKESRKDDETRNREV
jgi:hypothetical protein